GLQVLAGLTAIEVRLYVVFVEGDGCAEVRNCAVIILQFHLHIAAGEKSLCKSGVFFDGQVVIFHGTMPVVKRVLDVAPNVIRLRIILIELDRLVEVEERFHVLTPFVQLSPLLRVFLCGLGLSDKRREGADYQYQKSHISKNGILKSRLPI